MIRGVAGRADMPYEQKKRYLQKQEKVNAFLEGLFMENIRV